MKKKLILLAFALLLISESYAQEEIAQWRGPERNGNYPEKNLLSSWPAGGPPLLWKYDSLGSGYSSAAVTASHVYTVGMNDSTSYLFCFDLKGKLLWKSRLGHDWTVNWPGTRSSPLIYIDLGYVLNGEGMLYCFDLEKGKIAWQKDIRSEYGARSLEFGYCDNLVADGDKLFCSPAGLETTVVALNRKTGDLIWKSESLHDTNVYCSPILIERGGKKFYINQTRKSLYSVDAENGRIAWTAGLTGNFHPSTPLFFNGCLFAIDGGKSGSFMLKISEDGYSCSEIWRNTRLNVVQGHVVMLGDCIFGVCDRKIVCIDRKNGNEIFNDSVKSNIQTFIAAGNCIYSYSDKGRIDLIEPASSRLLYRGSFQLTGGRKEHCSHPVIRDGKLYIRHDNSLFVYNVSQGSPQ